MSPSDHFGKPGPRRSRAPLGGIKRLAGGRKNPESGVDRSRVTAAVMKITLLGTDPPIWRRVLVPADILLDDLHRIVQVTMQWSNSHLHIFQIHEQCYAPKEYMLDYPVEVIDSRTVRLLDLAVLRGFACTYEYDLGDSWLHEILVEDFRLKEPIENVTCLDGERASPPEDCGGVGGFYGMIEALADPSNPEHKHWVEWLTGEDTIEKATDIFDPEVFDIKNMNLVLAGKRPFVPT